MQGASGQVGKQRVLIAMLGMVKSPSIECEAALEDLMAQRGDPDVPNTVRLALGNVARTVRAGEQSVPTS